MLALLLLSAPLFEDARLNAALRQAPAPVQAFLQRRARCAHWGGEEPYDAARRRAIAQGLRQDRCDRIEQDEARIRSQHGRRRGVAALLDAGGPQD